MATSHRAPAPRWASTLVRAAGLLAVGALAVGLAAPAGAATGPSPSDKAQAQKAFLVKSDLPTGWTSTKNTDSGGTGGLTTGVPSADSQLASCAGVPLSLVKENPPTVVGPEFDSPGQQNYSLSQQVVVFPSASAAKTFKAAIANPKVSSCMQSLAQGPLKTKLLGGAPKGVSIGTLSISSTPSSSLPPGAAGLTAKVPVTEQGVTLNVVATQVIAVKGRLAQELNFYGAGKPFPTATQKHLVSVAAGRL